MLYAENGPVELKLYAFSVCCLPVSLSLRRQLRLHLWLHLPLLYLLHDRTSLEGLLASLVMLALSTACIHPLSGTRIHRLLASTWRRTDCHTIYGILAQKTFCAKCNYHFLL